MTGLETTYYIVGIVFMVVALIVLIAIVTALFVIRNKVVTLERNVQDKIHGITQNFEKVIDVVNTIREIAKSVKK